MNADNKVPTSIGIILDGNRRWAKEKGLPSVEGHQKGAEKLLDVTRWVRDRGIKHLAVYIFSNENWNRSEEEVSYLMRLLRTVIAKYFDALSKEGIRIRFVGDRDQLDPDIQKLMENVEIESSGNHSLTLWVCLSYGGRAEIVAAAHAAAAEGLVTESSLTAHLWTAQMPDPDIIIRTGGEKRLSGFLTWQSIYSELFFIDTYWPDFSEVLLDSILTEYKQRERRNGL